MNLRRPERPAIVTRMDKDSALMEMLTGYAAAHQHPFNIAVHLIGIPIIMLGVFIPLSWLSFDVMGLSVNGAYIAAIILFLFYMTLDVTFALVFLVGGMAIAKLATLLGLHPTKLSGTIAAAAFFGGYILQFVGHAVEKSMPVILKHPIQANLAAPFFTIVEVFGLLGLRKELFAAVQSRVAERREDELSTV